MARLDTDRFPLKGPLLAGLGVALALIAGVAALTWLAGGPAPTISASADIAGQPDVLAAAEIEGVRSAPFGDEEVEDVSLPGVRDTADALNAADPDAQPVAPATPQAPPAPLPGLYENGPGGPLPVISASGERPDQAYARDFDGAENVPTVSVIVGGLGLSQSLTERAIEVLPAEVTLSFAPYSDNLQDWINRARADGHEVLIELPMEPFDYPNNDPGPHTLLVDASTQENTRRLVWLLSRAAGYTGVVNYLGARLGAAQGPMTEVFTELEARGLSIFHDGAGRRAVLEQAGRQARARMTLADRVVDSDPTPRAIDGRLLELEALALQNGSALGSGFAYPATVDTIASWAEGLDGRGYQLAPASFVMQIRNPVEATSIASIETQNGADDDHSPSDDAHGDTH
ncbi:divergent polysaccharide deacetylase family protein [Oceanicaulis sp. MMSF_3324]|uniref:divergent polysaccharide deacetylase family protein n=1 Tax=Oceanicaulis sp. MMSF_3324 TaxID=3046702 RepID=UPI00273EE8C9|nr:divergent polysaccharide deacetylase family protein [Oceanicaulis sp. MMSF_3324]